MSLNYNQRRVLRGVLSPDYNGVPALAEKLDLGERTIYGYLADDEFQQKLNSGLNQAITEASLQLANLADLALQVYRDILTDQEASDTNRRLAADSVMGHLVKLVTEKQFLDRLERLEKWVYEQAN